MTVKNAAFFIAGQAGVTPVAMGSPGLAKTASCRALADATGRRFVHFVLQHHLPEDFGGFPVASKVRDSKGKYHEVMKRLPDERLLMASIEPSIILWDELTNAGNSLQAAALLLIQEGLPGCWMFAAANPPELAASGVELSPPMVNRLCVLNWQADEIGWDEGTRNGFEYSSPVVPVLPENWKSHCLKWGRLLVEFRQAFPDVWNVPPSDPGQAVLPFPSPRSWTNAGLLLSAAESVGADESVQAELVYGTVGQAAGTQFFQWVSQLCLPDPEQVLANPSRLKLPRRGDLAVAVLASCIGRVRENSTPDRWESLRDVVECAWQQNQEVATAAEGGMWSVKPADYLPKGLNGVAQQMAAARLGTK